MTTLPLLRVLASVVRMTRGLTLLVEVFGVEPMPFDGFLFGSRVMVRRRTPHPSLRTCIVAAAGVDDSQWEGTYVKDTGGIITVGIHKVNNRALRLWKEYDDTRFKLPREKRGAWLQEHRAEVIQRLNADILSRGSRRRRMVGS
jgi:fatty acid synthase subunit alpha